MKVEGIGTPVANVVAMEKQNPDQYSKTEIKLKRDKVMKQMADMQKRFLETYKSELDEIDLGNEPKGEKDTRQSSVQLQCALGVVPLMSHTLPPMEATCILCQEETKNVAGHEKVFVQAGQVLRSSVLKRCVKLTTDQGKEIDKTCCRQPVVWSTLHVHTHIHTYIHTLHVHTHTYTHTYTHTHTQSFQSVLIGNVVSNFRYQMSIVLCICASPATYTK